MCERLSIYYRKNRRENGGFFAHFMSIIIFPVSVLIVHFPPDSVFGTLTRPVSLLVENILSERKEPVTSPVDVFTNISAPSHASKETSPVLLSTEMLPFAITFLNVKAKKLKKEVMLKNENLKKHQCLLKQRLAYH